MNTNSVSNNLVEVVHGRFGEFLAKPLETVDATTKKGALKTGNVVNTHLGFGVEVDADAGTLTFLGSGLHPADAARAALFMLRQFSAADSLDGVAFRQTERGVSIMQVHHGSANGDFAVPADVLEQFVERGLVATAYLGSLGFFTNLADGGLDVALARRLARDAFQVYMPLFDQYDLAGFFETGDSAEEGEESHE